MTATSIWYAVILSSIVAASCIAIALFKDLPAKLAFTWHPVLMTLAFIVFMPQGMNHYWAGTLLEVDRAASRKKHAMYQIIAVLLAIGGWVAIFVAHSGASHTGSGASTVKQIHVWLGYLVLLGVVFQGFIGMMKLRKKFAKWHGVVGPAIWFLGAVNVFLGACFWAGKSYVGPVQIVTVICILITVSMTLLLRTLAKNQTKEENETYAPVQTNIPY